MLLDKQIITWLDKEYDIRYFTYNLIRERIYN